MKRTMDIVISAVLLLLLSPLMLVIAILVKLGSRGPIFYKARRAGRGGAPFLMYKFRTMKEGADNEGPPLTPKNDNRVTGAGRVLRGARLDELPQLLNVIKGDMSLVGPRPEDPSFIKYYSPEQRRALDLRPGITGPSQLDFMEEEALLGYDDLESRYVNDIMPRKLAIDVDYVENHGFFSDLRILARTLTVPIRSRQG